MFLSLRMWSRKSSMRDEISLVERLGRKPHMERGMMEGSKM